MKRKLTAEQEAKRDERKAKFQALSKRLAAMPKEERDKVSAEAGTVVTIEGHGLSARNTILCYWQRQGVTMVGGFRQWIRAGRCVRKGEHGLSILVPCGGGTDKDTGETEKTFFVGGTVFDVSQTEELQAAELPTALTPEPAAVAESVQAVA